MILTVKWHRDGDGMRSLLIADEIARMLLTDEYKKGGTGTSVHEGELQKEFSKAKGGDGRSITYSQVKDDTQSPLTLAQDFSRWFVCVGVLCDRCESYTAS